MYVNYSDGNDGVPTPNTMNNNLSNGKISQRDLQTIDGFFEIARDEDEFMIKKENPAEHKSSMDDHRSALLELNNQSAKKRKISQKKYNHTKSFMNMTMAQMVKNREVDPLVNATNRAALFKQA